MPNISQGPISGNKGRIYRDNLHPAEAHTKWEIMLILEGTGYMEVEGEQIPFQPGTILCVPPYHVHQNIPDDYYNDYCLIIEKYLVPGNDVSVFQDDSDNSFQHLIRLYDRVNTNHPVNYENILSTLEALMQHILICWQDQKPSKELLQLAQAMRKRSMDPAFKASDAIAEIPMNPDYVRRQFHQQFGCTPVAYLNKLRVENACRYLIATGYNISELSYRCGFNDPRYFNRIFRSIPGMTPKEYHAQSQERKRYRDAHRGEQPR
ncbi:MAG: helix-turn-helix domain-containing protein [Oscillospiraceae bacterium]|nr:helix-turn-helix domain-containing protein [Oscillospiraceae bacterium]